VNYFEKRTIDILIPICWDPDKTARENLTKHLEETRIGLLDVYVFIIGAILLLRSKK